MRGGSDVALADRSVGDPVGEHLADALGGQLLAGAEPVDHERQDQLGIELEHAGDQRVVGQPGDRLDDGSDQALPAVARPTPAPSGRRRRRPRRSLR